MSVTISGSGQIIKQVISVIKTDTTSTSSSTFSDVTGLSVTITPTNANNKILIIGSINMSWTFGATKAAARISRNGTAIAIGDAAGSRVRTTGGIYIDSQNYGTFAIPVTYLDSPATTSPVTYTWQINATDNNAASYVNRASNDTDSTITPRSASFITVMEVAYA